MNTPPKATQVQRLRQATGLGWLAARQFLMEKSSDLCERMIQAHEVQDGPTLYDPREDDLHYGPIIAQAKARAEAQNLVEIARDNAQLIAEGHAHMVQDWPRGSCYRIWHLMKADLQQQGIVWYSLADMNPGHHFC